MDTNELNDFQSRFILERIHQTEKNSSLLLEEFCTYARKESKVRDKMDKLAQVVKKMSENEKHNLKAVEAYEKMVIGFTHIADNQDDEIDSIMEKVVQDLSQYQTICVNSREEIKNQLSLRDKEFSKRKHLENNQKRNENDFMISNIQISKILKEILSISGQFEIQKNNDFKEIFSTFLLIQLKYHAKCLETFTELYGNIEEIDVEQDSESYLEKLRKINKQLKKRVQHDSSRKSGFSLSRIRSQSLGALNSILEKKSPSEKPASSSRKSLNLSNASLNSLKENKTNKKSAKKDAAAFDLSADSLETKSTCSDDGSESETEGSSEEEEKKPKESSTLRSDMRTK